MCFSMIPSTSANTLMTCKFSVLFKFILVTVTDEDVTVTESADNDHSKTAGKEIDYSLSPESL